MNNYTYREYNYALGCYTDREQTVQGRSRIEAASLLATRLGGRAEGDGYSVMVRGVVQYRCHWVERG